MFPAQVLKKFTAYSCSQNCTEGAHYSIKRDDKTGTSSVILKREGLHVHSNEVSIVHMGWVTFPSLVPPPPLLRWKGG